MPVETLLRSEDCNCFAVRSAARHIRQLYDQFLAPIGLRTTQFSILAKLKRREPLTINALAKDMRIQPTASDRRVKELHLTKAGEKHLAAALKGWVAAQARFEGAYGTKRAADLRGLLRAVVASEFAP
jgi:DNA-binding MarR family transcriptional regulator